MLTKYTLDFMLEFSKMHGPLGITIIVLIGLLIYQARQKEKERKECRDDFIRVHTEYRTDVDSQNKKMLSSFDKNTAALSELSIATNALSIHVQACQKP